MYPRNSILEYLEVDRNVNLQHYQHYVTSSRVYFKYTTDITLGIYIVK